MRQIPNFDQVQETGERKQLKPGIYPLVITDVVDVPDKEYLEVYFDITDGEFKNYFNDLSKNAGKDYSRTIRSYKESALPFFKSFITAVEKTNSSYKWDWNEKSLKGKNVIGVFGEEEYLNKDNEVAVMCRLQEFRSLEAYQQGKLKVPELKKLQQEEPKTEDIGSNFNLPF